jgi:hypothetical protein
MTSVINCKTCNPTTFSHERRIRLFPVCAQSHIKPESPIAIAKIKVNPLLKATLQKNEIVEATDEWREQPREQLIQNHDSSDSTSSP